LRHITRTARFFPRKGAKTVVAKRGSESYSKGAVSDGIYFSWTTRNVAGAKEIRMSSLTRIALVVLVSALVIPTIATAQGTGADTFKAKCAMCHGADGTASTGMGKSMGLKSLASPDVQKMSDTDMTALVTNGKGKMPAFKGKLTDAQVTDVVKYVHTLK
jgi:cytochrome c6